MLMMKLRMIKNAILWKEMRQNLMIKMKILHNFSTKRKMQQHIMKDQLVQKMMINLIKFVKVKKLMMKEVARMLIQLKNQ